MFACLCAYECFASAAAHTLDQSCGQACVCSTDGPACPHAFLCLTIVLMVCRACTVFGGLPLVERVEKVGLPCMCTDRLCMGTHAPSSIIAEPAWARCTKHILRACSKQLASAGVGVIWPGSLIVLPTAVDIKESMHCHVCCALM